MGEELGGCQEVGIGVIYAGLCMCSWEQWLRAVAPIIRPFLLYIFKSV